MTLLDIPISFRTQGPSVEHNGVVRTFRTTDGAERFLALVGKRTTVTVNMTAGTTRASDVHQPSQRVPSERPACLLRHDRKAQLQVIRSAPPPNHYPPKIVRPAAQAVA